MLRPLLFTLLLSVLTAAAAHPAPPRPRPYSGCGVLTVKPDAAGAESRLPFYQEPGVARVAELDTSSLPRLAGSSAQPLVAVSARKGGWSRLAYDDAGREGWIEQPRSWQYLPWQEFLPGRLVRILPGMKKGQYALRSDAAEGAPETGSLTRDQTVQVLQVREEWVLLQSPSGWFKWRDGDGRLTVSLTETEAGEKR